MGMQFGLSTIINKDGEKDEYDDMLASLTDELSTARVKSMFDDLESEVNNMSNESLAESKEIINSVDIEQDLEAIKQYCTEDELKFVDQIMEV